MSAKRKGFKTTISKWADHQWVYVHEVHGDWLFRKWGNSNSEVMDPVVLRYYGAVDTTTTRLLFDTEARMDDFLSSQDPALGDFQRFVGIARSYRHQGVVLTVDEFVAELQSTMPLSVPAFLSGEDRAVALLETEVNLSGIERGHYSRLRGNGERMRWTFEGLFDHKSNMNMFDFMSMLEHLDLLADIGTGAVSGREHQLAARLHEYRNALRSDVEHLQDLTLYDLVVRSPQSWVSFMCVWRRKEIVETASSDLRSTVSSMAGSLFMVESWVPRGLNSRAQYHWQQSKVVPLDSKFRRPYPRETPLDVAAAW